MCPQRYSQRPRSLGLFLGHFAGDPKACQCLCITRSRCVYIGRRLERSHASAEERADDRRERAARRSDQRAHLLAIVDYTSGDPHARTLSHTVAVCHVVHRTRDPDHTSILLRESATRVDRRLGRVR